MLGNTKELSVPYLDKSDFKDALPPAFKGKVTDEVMSGINGLLSNHATRDMFRENLIGYSNVLSKGRYKLQDYIKAIEFVGHRVLDLSNLEAYAKTFPNRYKRLVNEGVKDHKISAYASAYNKNQLVQGIFTQAMIPTYILNVDVFQRAINTQAVIMSDPNVSARDRSFAANSLLTHLKKPESTKIELDLNAIEDTSIKELREATMALAANQRAMIESGMMNAKEVAHSPVIEHKEEEE